jgi:subtilisin family serine protease
MSKSKKRQRRLAAKEVRAYRAKPCVEQLENRVQPSATHLLASMIHAQGIDSSGVSLAAAGPVTPADPSFRSQWDLKDIGLQTGWSYTTGSTRTTVGVIDTGIDYNHQDLYDNIWINQAEIPASRKANLRDVDGDGLITFYDLNNPLNQGVGKITDLNHDGRIDAADILAPMIKTAAGKDTGLGGWADGISEDGDTQHIDDLVGWNFVANNNKPYDDNGHGTHVSGTIGAMGNNGVGVTGIDWRVQLMALKFMNASGQGNLQLAAEALNYAVKHGAQITNNSWGGSGAYQPFAVAVANAQAQGVIVVASAGNNGQNLAASPFYPASYGYGNVVRVAALDSAHQLASFSNFGSALVQVAAPGVSILSTTPNNTYSYYSGTSMAAPHVTGVLALLRDEHPTWTYQQLISWMVSKETPLTSLQGKTTAGGELNAAAALYVQAPVSKPPVKIPPPVVHPKPPVVTPPAPTPPASQNSLLRFLSSRYLQWLQVGR